MKVGAIMATAMASAMMVTSQSGLQVGWQAGFLARVPPQEMPAGNGEEAGDGCQEGGLMGWPTPSGGCRRRRIPRPSPPSAPAEPTPALEDRPPPARPSDGRGEGWTQWLWNGLQSEVAVVEEREEQTLTAERVIEVAVWGAKMAVLREGATRLLAIADGLLAVADARCMSSVPGKG